MVVTEDTELPNHMAGDTPVKEVQSPILCTCQCLFNAHCSNSLCKTCCLKSAL